MKLLEVALNDLLNTAGPPRNKYAVPESESELESELESESELELESESEPEHERRPPLCTKTASNVFWTSFYP